MGLFPKIKAKDKYLSLNPSKKMAEYKVLIACEFSGIVRDAFIKRGVDAISCDILPTELPGPHYQGRVEDILYSQEWKAIFAFPPCTYLANSGVQHLHLDKSRWEKMNAAREFFFMFFNADCEKICIENPVPHKYARLPVYNQIINPSSFGHKMLKRTCLWLKGLPPLMASKIMDTGNIERYIDKDGRNHGPMWYHTCKPENGSRSKPRSRTFPGIAEAMADQWADVIRSDK